MMRTIPIRAALAYGLGLGALALSAGGCFSESVTLGLACNALEQCGVDQVCDGSTNRCVLLENASMDNSGAEESEEDADAGEQCPVDDEQRCAQGGIDVQICTSGIWLPTDCDQVCANANIEPGAGMQVGACVDEGDGVSCLCADGVGGECLGNEPRSCTPAGLLEICLSGRFFRLECTTDCGSDGYPTAGPCVEGEGQGAADCVCADGLGASCSLSEQFTEECLDADFLQRCVDGQWYQTDCTEECDRNGGTGGTCELNGSVSSCVCEIGRASCRERV